MHSSRLLAQLRSSQLGSIDFAVAEADARNLGTARTGNIGCNTDPVEEEDLSVGSVRTDQAGTEGVDSGIQVEAFVFAAAASAEASVVVAAAAAVEAAVAAEEEVFVVVLNENHYLVFDQVVQADLYQLVEACLPVEMAERSDSALVVVAAAAQVVHFEVHRAFYLEMVGFDRVEHPTEAIVPWADEDQTRVCPEVDVPEVDVPEADVPETDVPEAVCLSEDDRGVACRSLEDDRPNEEALDDPAAVAAYGARSNLAFEKEVVDVLVAVSAANRTVESVRACCPIPVEVPQATQVPAFAHIPLMRFHHLFD